MASLRSISHCIVVLAMLTAVAAIRTDHEFDSAGSSSIDSRESSPDADSEAKRLPNLDHRRLSRVIYPAAGVSGLVFAAILLLALRSSNVPSEDRREEVGRKSSLAGHPLMLHAQLSGAKQILHPETSFTEDFVQAFTRRRVTTFAVAVLASFLLAMSTEPRDFAISQTVKNIPTEEACMAACKSLGPNTVCENKIEFTKKGGTYETTSCAFPTVPDDWKIDVVLISLIIGIYLIVDGCTTEIVLIGMVSMYAVLGVISTSEAFNGVAKDSVVGLALLFPIAAALEETGALDSALGVLLGSPTSYYVALIRMMVPVAFLSAFLNNTAIVTMMIPVIISWSRSLGVHPGKLLMPLSFAAQLGGSCSLIGSSSCVVAKSSVDRTVYDMQFFDLAPCGSLLCLCTFIAILVFVPLLTSSAEVSSDSATTEENPSKIEKRYVVSFAIRSGSSYAGMDASEVCDQLKRMPGVMDVVAAGDNPLQEGCLLQCAVEDAGVVSLRQLKGLEIENEQDLLALGMERERRHLYEVVVDTESAMKGLPADADVMREALGACLISFRGKKASDPVESGDILLLEADERYVGGKVWQHEFCMTKMVPDSSPQRAGGVHDRVRCVLICVGMAALVSLVATEWVKLSAGGGVFVCVLVMTNADSVANVYKTIKGPVLLTIAGACGLSEALQQTGIAMYASTSVTHLALPFGNHALRAALYILCAFLSLFMNNAASIAIIGPMLAGMARKSCGEDAACQHKEMKALVFCMVYGAGTCLTSPLGYQTNLMVMKDGGYTFADFAKFGGCVQLIHFAGTLLIIYLCVDVLSL